MANSIPSWEEWNEQLSEEQRQYSLYKTLQSLDKRLGSLENAKWFNRSASAISGFFGGASVIIAKFVFWR